MILCENMTDSRSKNIPCCLMCCVLCKIPVVRPGLIQLRKQFLIHKQEMLVTGNRFFFSQLSVVSLESCR